LDLLLMPADDERKELVATDVGQLHAAAEHLDSVPERNAWMEELHALQEIWAVLRDQWGVAPVQSILRLQCHLPQLSPSSAASFLLLLWQSSQGLLLRGTERSRLVYSLLSGDAIDQFIREHPSLSGSTSLRLRIAGSDTDVFWSVQSMTRVQFIRHLQKQMGERATYRAYRELEGATSKAMAMLEKTAATFQQVETDARALGDLHTAAICCHYWGRSYYQTAASPWDLLEGADPDKELLQKALTCLCRAYDTAVDASDHDQAVASACQAALVSHDSRNEEGYQEFLSKAQDHAAQSGDPRHGMMLEEVRERRSLIRGRADYVRQQPADDFVVLDDEAMQGMAEACVRAMGIPRDRIDNVVDDLKKINAVSNVRKTFCEHFVALQNLEHMSSPRTAYVRPTKYVGKCDLLGHGTRIECEDIDTVIHAFKEVHCKGCERRRPGVVDPSD